MKNKPLSIPVAALVSILVLVLLDLAGGIMHLTFLPWFKWLPTLLFLIAIALICVNYPRPEDEYNLSFSGVFVYGLKVSALAAVFMLAYTFLSLTFIFPEMKELALEEARKNLVAKGNLPQETIDSALNMTRSLFMTFALIGTVIGTFITGLIGSLIGAAIASKKKAKADELFQ